MSLSSATWGEKELKLIKFGDKKHFCVFASNYLIKKLKRPVLPVSDLDMQEPEIAAEREVR